MFKKAREEKARMQRIRSQTRDNMTVDERRAETAVINNSRFDVCGVSCKMWFNIFTMTIQVSILKEDVHWLDREGFIRNVRAEVVDILESYSVEKMPAMTFEYVAEFY